MTAIRVHPSSALRWAALTADYYKKFDERTQADRIPMETLKKSDQVATKPKSVSNEMAFLRNSLRPSADLCSA